LSLWIARSLLHQGLDFSDDPINAEFTRDIWNRAIQQIPKWPGFKRISMSKKDAEYYEHEMKLAAGLTAKFQTTILSPARKHPPNEV
jgi:hypothetical protein